jgi:hypothetical protein
MPRKVKTEEAKAAESEPCNCSCHKKAKASSPRKPPSATQLAAREQFKSRVAAAKKLREQHPDWPMSKCIKEASAK